MKQLKLPLVQFTLTSCKECPVQFECKNKVKRGGTRCIKKINNWYGYVKAEQEEEDRYD